MTRVSFFPERRTAPEIMEWYASVKRALEAREQSVLTAIDEERATPGEFLGMTADEVSTWFEEHRSELELAAILLLLTESEAVLRVDYLVRVYQRRKDDVSRAFRELYKEKGTHARLDEDLLAIWLDHVPEVKSGVSAYRSLLHLRNWLAHGRYWSPKLGRSHQDYDAELVHDELTIMFAKLTDVLGWA